MLRQTHTQTQANTDTRVYFVEGQPVELWEDPSFSFGWTAEDLSGYAVDGRWDLVFNGLVLNGVLEGTL